MALDDKTLTCRDCGIQFAFTVGEQEFYQTRGLLHEPTRCPQCRSSKRQSRFGDGGGSGGPRPMFTTVCAACGGEATVPFEPRLGRPVYCSDCFASQRGQPSDPAGGTSDADAT